MYVQNTPRVAPMVSATCAHGGRDGRSDDKSAQDYSLEGGATLHLVLALRGGSCGCL